MVMILVAISVAGKQYCLAVQNAPPLISVLLSHNAAPYEETLDGIKEALAQSSLPNRIEVFRLNGDARNADKALEDAKSQKGNLIVSIGSIATSAALKKVENIPVIAGLVLNRQEIKDKSNVTGVSLEFPVDLQLQWLSRILPDFKNVGTIYSPHFAQRIMEAHPIAQKLGLRLHAESITAPSQLPFALDSLAKRAEVLWAIPDEMVFNHETAKHFLLFSFRNRIPVVGLSDAWVKAGALYALGWDFKDMGMQCGEMAAAVLKGAPPKSIPLASPRKVRVVLNLRTAQALKIKIPDQIVWSAEIVDRSQGTQSND